MLLEIDGQIIHYKVFQPDLSVENELSGLAETYSKSSDFPLGGGDIIFLHGWGTNIEIYSKLLSHLGCKFRTHALDLPGFGLSSKPQTSWSTKNYAELAAAFAKKLQIEKPILIGHSLGGKIAIYMAAHGLVAAKKLIAIASAGIKTKKTFRRLCKIFSYKLLKNVAHLPLLKDVLHPILDTYRNKYGSADYREASGIMRTTLVTLVNEDIRALLPKITIPALLIWGDRDQDTPIANGQLMQKMLVNAKLLTLKNCGHYAFLDDWDSFSSALDEFL